MSSPPEKYWTLLTTHCPLCNTEIYYAARSGDGVQLCPRCHYTFKPKREAAPTPTEREGGAADTTFWLRRVGGTSRKVLNLTGFSKNRLA